jgi:hypothetical protein
VESYICTPMKDLKKEKEISSSKWRISIPQYIDTHIVLSQKSNHRAKTSLVSVLVSSYFECLDTCDRLLFSRLYDMPNLKNFKSRKAALRRLTGGRGVSFLRGFFFF